MIVAGCGLRVFGNGGNGFTGYDGYYGYINQYLVLLCYVVVSVKMYKEFL